MRSLKVMKDHLTKTTTPPMPISMMDRFETVQMSQAKKLRPKKPRKAKKKAKKTEDVPLPQSIMKPTSWTNSNLK